MASKFVPSSEGLLCSNTQLFAQSLAVFARKLFQVCNKQGPISTVNKIAQYRTPIPSFNSSELFQVCNKQGPISTVNKVAQYRTPIPSFNSSELFQVCNKQGPISTVNKVAQYRTPIPSFNSSELFQTMLKIVVLLKDQP